MSRKAGKFAAGDFSLLRCLTDSAEYLTDSAIFAAAS